MSAGVEQADGLMLAVDLDQQSAQFTQHANAGRLIVYEHTRTPVGGDHPA